MHKIVTFTVITVLLFNTIHAKLQNDYDDISQEDNSLKSVPESHNFHKVSTSLYAPVAPYARDAPFASTPQPVGKYSSKVHILTGPNYGQQILKYIFN